MTPFAQLNTVKSMQDTKRPFRGLFSYEDGECIKRLRVRMYYPRADYTHCVDGRWTDFDKSVLQIMNGDVKFVMHHESDTVVARQLSTSMENAINIHDEQSGGFFSRKRFHKLCKVDHLSNVADQFNFGIWWDIVTCSDFDALLERISATGTNPQEWLHNQSNGIDPGFVLFRNFYTDEISIRCHPDFEDDVFRLAKDNEIPLLKSENIDFMQDVFAVDNYLRPTGLHMK